MTGDPSLLNHYMWSMAKCITGFENTETIYKAVVKEYEAKHGPGVTADYAAADDPRLRQAIGDGGWYRDKAQTYALGAIALMLHKPWEGSK